ncbi:MAG TPA: hypothetical protein VI434_08335 [Candidatus Dormibacteraeota bacterium]
MTPMRSLLRWTGIVGAVLCMLAAVAMCVASYLPFTGGDWGDGLQTGNDVSSQVTVNIISGSDVWLVLATVVTLGVVAASHLGGMRPQLTSLIAVGATLVALGLALKLPGTWQVGEAVPGEPYLLLAGFYVFLGGAVTAVVGALLMFVSSFARLAPNAEALRPRPLPDRTPRPENDPSDDARQGGGSTMATPSAR